MKGRKRFMDIHRIEMLFKEVSHISREYEKMAKLSGENFNIFKTLNLATAEVRLHSAILAEFLNSKGSHGQDDLFFDLFVKQLKITNFDTKSASVELEKHIGKTNSDYTEGGRIDIFLQDRTKKSIMIENKIHAGDQEKQLVRYHNAYPEATLFYLTLYGEKPTAYSTNDGEIREDEYKTLSYKYDIINWLDACKKEAVSLPIIRETITQYINLLKYLTGQTTMEKMKDEIKKLIRKNPEIAEHACVIKTCVDEVKSECQEKFIKILEQANVGLKSEFRNEVGGNGINYYVDLNNSFFRENKFLKLIFQIQDIFSNKCILRFGIITMEDKPRKKVSNQVNGVLEKIERELRADHNYFPKDENGWWPAGGIYIGKDKDIFQLNWLSDSNLLENSAKECSKEINDCIEIIKKCLPE